MKRTLIALATGCLLLTGCSQVKEEQTFTGAVQYVGNADRIYTSDKECTFAGHSVKDGDGVLLRGSDDRILGKSTLDVIKMEGLDQGRGVCHFAAVFTDIVSGDSAYQAELTGLGTEVFTEDELEKRTAVSDLLKNWIEVGLSQGSGR